MTGLIGYAHDECDSLRELDFGNIELMTRSDYVRNQFNSCFETSYTIPWSYRASFQPFAGLYCIDLHKDFLNESGGGGSLAVAGDDVDSLRTSLGARLISSIE